MQQFVVPQFLDVENKIFFFVTTRQFLILLTASIFCFIFYKLFDFPLFAISSLLTIGSAGVVAFGKIKGQMFHFFLLNLLQTLRKPSLRIWYKTYATEELNYLRSIGVQKEAEAAPEKKNASRQHIRDLSLIVNTGGYYQGKD